MRIFLFLLALIFVAGCAEFPNLPSFTQGEEWHRAEFSEFVFSLPPGFGKFGAGNMGPAMAQYTNENMIITFDGGATAGDRLDALSKFKNYQSHMEVIHGKGVQMVTFDIPPGPGHRFDNAIAASYRGIGLTLYVHCRTKDDYATATEIFKTVRFKLF